MKPGKGCWSDREVVGIRLLAHAIKRNAAKVAARYSVGGVRDACCAVDALGDAMLGAVNNGHPFTIEFYTQGELPNFELSDEAYSEVE